MQGKDKLKQLRRLISDIADGKSNAKAVATKALSLIDEMIGKGTGRGEADVAYVVEDSVNGLVLTERRSGGRAHPLRCPQSVYEALAKVMSQSDRALPVDELVAAVGEKLGDSPPDYQVRVALRFWMQVEPPVVQRNRARYRMINSKSFSNTAVMHWKGVAKQ